MEEELPLNSLMDEKDKVEDGHLHDETMRLLKNFKEEELICMIDTKDLVMFLDLASFHSLMNQCKFFLSSSMLKIFILKEFKEEVKKKHSNLVKEDIKDFMF